MKQGGHHRIVSACMSETFDVILRGGIVLDGTGAPAIRADVGIRSDKIAALESDLSRAEAPQVLDMAGLIVCPGFIDVHSHSDVYLLIEPDAPSKIRQGVTTEVVGNCGASGAPLRPSYRLPSDWVDKPIPGRWSSLGEFRELLDKTRPAVNSVLLVGHNTLHAGVAGYDARPASEDELRSMEALLERSLDEGAAGMSTGLLYAPGLYADRSEVVRLARVVAAKGGIYTTHMRSEGDELLESIGETLDVARQTGVRVEISHLKTSGRRNWHRLPAAIGLIEEALASGIEVAADRYPYTASYTDLDVLFPVWAAEGGRDRVLQRLRTPADCERLREALRAGRDAEGWRTITIGSTSHPDNFRFRGRSLADVARELGMEPVDAVLHLALTDELRTGAFFFGMSEDNMRAILAEPYVMLGSDASIRAPHGPLSTDYPHPRAYGSFPKFLRMALDGKTVPLPEAVRKITSLPADHFRLRGRGRIAVRMAADLVAFAPESVRDKATFGQPHQYSEGIDTVMVNGQVTMTGGHPTGIRGGRVLAETAR
jgi:N-acyl-D-amino-acid deacylase